MPKYPKSLIGFAGDTGESQLQQKAISEIYAQHGINYQKMTADRGKWDYIRSLSSEALAQAEVHKWVLENAAIRGRREGFNIWGLLRMMADFRSRSRKELD